MVRPNVSGYAGPSVHPLDDMCMTCALIGVMTDILCLQSNGNGQTTLSELRANGSGWAGRSAVRMTPGHKAAT